MSMSSRKRPTESRSRGNSPPHKRNCTPKRTASLQDRYADTRDPPSFPSPPASRRSSTYTRPNVPSGPRSDQHRPVTNYHQAFQRSERHQGQPRDPHDAYILSPNSSGSGASTPAHHVAPTVPSMLPRVRDSVHASHAARIQQHEAAGTANSKPTMDSLRKIRERRRAAALRVLDVTAVASHTAAPTTDANPSRDIGVNLHTTISELQNLRPEWQAAIRRIDALEQSKRPAHNTDPTVIQIKIESLENLLKKLDETNGKQAEDIKNVLARQTTVESTVKDLLTLKADMASFQDWTKSILETWKGVQPTEMMTRSVFNQELTAKLAAAKKDMHTHVDTTKENLLNDLKGKSIIDRIEAVEAEISSSSFSTQVEQVTNSESKRQGPYETLSATITQIKKEQEEANRRLQKLETLETRVELNKNTAADAASLEDRINKGISSLKTSFEGQVNKLEEDCEKNEKDIHDCGTRCSVLEESVPELFKEKFEPLQNTVQEALNEINEIKRTAREQVEERSAMRGEFSNWQKCTQQAQSSAASAINTTAAQKEDIKRLETSVHEVKTGRDKAISDLDERWTTTLNKEMDAFRLTLRNLHDQYANITTDDIYQRMVHWFVQMYPNNASMLQQFTALKEDVTRLRSLEPQFLWLQSNALNIQTLLDKGHQSQLSPEASGRIEEACNQAKDASSKVNDMLGKEATSKADLMDKVAEKINTAVTSLTDLSSPFARISKIEQLENQLTEVKNVNRDLIEPNKEFLPLLGKTIITTAQAQRELDKLRAHVFIPREEGQRASDSRNTKASLRDSIHVRPLSDIKWVCGDLSESLADSWPDEQHGNYNRKESRNNSDDVESETQQQLGHR
ncbi:hypothetical protein T440DRAFT_464422 [Plenodomus tracheiphilus IPT5]|uniref:Uncharacterized protein n=1 Tax=Plenodomus tracheiphilus IPT5 TaxID=1408161 RepID=A0A6A7BIQ1_9PLEO|nr:hypothetical protein T440DRAFT_464422 [Plenodomus tracheiphilus IPT5]